MQQCDHNHGQLGKQREELIQETAVALEEQLNSKSQRHGGHQSEHEEIFAVLKEDLTGRETMQFAIEQLLKDIASAQNYMEVEQ